PPTRRQIQSWQPPSYTIGWMDVLKERTRHRRYAPHNTTTAPSKKKIGLTPVRLRARAGSGGTGLRSNPTTHCWITISRRCASGLASRAGHLAPPSKLPPPPHPLLARVD